MVDDINVKVVDYGPKRKLMLRYTDPITGKHVAKTSKTRNRTLAERAAAKWETELREGKYKPLTRIDWEEFKDKYRAEVLSGKSAGNEENKDTIFNHIERLINPQRLGELTTPRLSGFVAKLREEKMKETTLAGYLSHLSAALKWAVKQGYLRVMPDIPDTEADGVTRTMRSSPVTGEELDRIIAKVPSKRKKEPEKWQRLLRGLDMSGLRLGEALALSWDPGSVISVDTSGKYPALRIFAEAEKGRIDRLLPIAPDFAELLLAVPKGERKGLVFGIYGKGEKPLSTKRASNYIAAFGEAAGVITNKAEHKFASAHDLRRAFGTRWSKRVMPAILKELMRHSSINTTLKYYIEQQADDLGDLLRKVAGNTSGNTDQKPTTQRKVAPHRNGIKIRS